MFAAGAASAGEVELSGGMTMVGQWIAAGDEASLPDGRIGEMSSSFDLEAQTQFSPRLRGYLHLEASAGGGIDAHVTMYGAANADAAGTAAAEVSEAWLEGNLGAGWTVFVGKADVSAIVDANDVAGDETAQFLNASFRNSTAAFFPMDNAAAAWLSWVPEDGPVEAVVGWAEADADWQFVFEDPYLFGEVGLRLGPSGERGRVGIYAWSASGVNTPLAGTVGSTSGWGLSARLNMTEGLKVFARYGQRDASDFEVAAAYSVGAELSHMAWAGEDDVFAVAFGTSILGDKYRAATPGAADESILEAYCRLKLSDGLALSPSVQTVWNAGGVRSDALVLVGLRAQADF